ncbi:MAG: hypothetical protein KDH96_11770 [Candidatus Riesia sp.]|nr:hypothetical protein [Candidatus Riesia sp.]
MDKTEKTAIKLIKGATVWASPGKFELGKAKPGDVFPLSSAKRVCNYYEIYIFSGEPRYILSLAATEVKRPELEKYDTLTENQLDFYLAMTREEVKADTETSESIDPIKEFEKYIDATRFLYDRAFLKQIRNFSISPLEARAVLWR